MSNTEVGKDLWNSIWKMEVPNKVRHFLWRAVRESLPTKSNLHRRQVLSSGVCDACSDCTEDGIHALWFCDAVKPIWMSDARFSFLRAHQLTNFGDLFQLLYLRGSSNLIALFAMVSWGIWERQNRVREGQKSWDKEALLLRASEVLQALLTPRLAVQRCHLRWKPPDPGVYKINFDGALFLEQRCAGLGVVVRDSAGLVIAALSQRVRLPGSVDVVEALAACRAMRFAQELSLHHMVIEGDSLQVIQAIIDTKPVQTLYGHIIGEIKLLSSLFTCSFLHVNRKGNMLAHALARRAVLSADTEVWIEELPQDLEDVI